MLNKFVNYLHIICCTNVKLFCQLRYVSFILNGISTTEHC
jgi:hypothetical protein